MDLSKLPRFSQTPPPPNDRAPESTPTNESKKGADVFCRCGAPLPAGTRFCSHCGASYREATGDRPSREPEGGFWVEAFLCIGVGIFLLLMSPGGLGYWKATLAGQPYLPYAHPTEQGKAVDYIEMKNLQTGQITRPTYKELVNGFWSDTAVTAFALTLILEGLIIALVRNRWVIGFSALLIAGVAILNLWVVIKGYTTVNPTASIIGGNYGLFPMSAIAFIFGVVMAGYQFMMFREMSRRA
ncbi:MAG TPA: zinc ribbon domain-containing protein [Tepidisphaeraceae bacterium]|nr:zinc ribbon domain-containing protein [Tepidisphaeraceae bacterium]